MHANHKMAFRRRGQVKNGVTGEGGAGGGGKMTMNAFFGTVGSPIKMSRFDVHMDKKAREKNNQLLDQLKSEDILLPQNEVVKKEKNSDVSISSLIATIDLKKNLSKVPVEKKRFVETEQKEHEQNNISDEIADIATIRNDGGRRHQRRKSTEFIGAPMEPVGQLRLDGAKKAKIPHFMSAWFGGNENHHENTEPTGKGNQLDNDNKPENKPEIAQTQTIEKPVSISSNCRQSIDFSEITLGRMIGEGAFGKVHEGKWRGKPVAVKLLICQDLRSDILHEFQQEVEIMSGLKHPNICRLLGACMEPPHRALVVELLQRGSLWGVLRTNRRSLTPEMRLKFIYDTAKGMSYLHHFNRPICHRDLKSPNLLVDKNYNIKISDFGLARVKAHVQTMTGNCGTVQWMAPEVLGNQKYTEKADVFSFGIVIWEVVTGECPYDGMSQIQAALGVLNRNLRPTIPRDCPPFLSRLMKACWNRQPELRPSFPNIVKAFRTYQASTTTSLSNSSTTA